MTFSVNLKEKCQGVKNWLKGFSVDREYNLIFAWSLVEASVYQLSDGKHYFSYYNLFLEKERMITQMLYMPKYRYIVVSTECGDLKVYKWESQMPPITEFKGIEKPIRSLARHPYRVN